MDRHEFMFGSQLLIDFFFKTAVDLLLFSFSFFLFLKFSNAIYSIHCLSCAAFLDSLQDSIESY